MLSRALTLAAVISLLGCLVAAPVEAQNLEAGKPPSAIFSSTCSLCHKSPRGLIKSVSPGSLPGFLRQHYTTSTDMASAMSAYVLSNGAANAAPGGGNLTRQGEESRSAPKPGPEQSAKDGTKDGAKGRKPTREASRPDADGLSGGPGTETAPDAPKNDAAKSDGAKGAKQKAAKGKPKAEPPGAQASREPPASDPKTETRPDPVPPVTPAGTETAIVPPAPKSVDDLPKGPLTVDIQPADKPPVPSAPPAGPPVVPVSQ